MKKDVELDRSYKLDYTPWIMGKDNEHQGRPTRKFGESRHDVNLKKGGQKDRRGQQIGGLKRAEAATRRRVALIGAGALTLASGGTAAVILSTEARVAVVAGSVAYGTKKARDFRNR